VNPPLEGTRVLDLSQGAAGPTAAMLLGEMGADVVKVEPPGGEWGRGLGPPFIGDVAAAYVGMNRNKRSIAVDLKRPGADHLVLELARGSDVVLESFRPGVADRLGIGHEAIDAINPRVVYVAISAFGQEGPWRDRPGVDGVVQAMSGLMSVTGTEDGPPVKVGVPAADMTGGFFAVQAVLAALLARERTGRGQRADVSLLDSLLAFQLVPLTMYLADDAEPPKPMGSAAPYAAPNETFPTGDGHVMVAAYTAQRWPRLCEVVGRPELATDPRFDTNDKRVRDRGALRAELEPLFRQRSTAEWVQLLDDADILCGPLMTYPELVAEPHVAERGALITTAYDEHDHARTVAGPIRLSATPTGNRRPAPGFGEHTRELLAELGLSDDEVDALFRGGVVLGERTRESTPGT